MLTQVEIVCSGQTLTLPILSAVDSPVQIVDIEGLGPVNADISSIRRANLLGESPTSSSIGKRNIVLTFRLNPDWSINQSLGALRATLYRYFRPSADVDVKLTADHLPGVVKVAGKIESMDPDMFSPDPQMRVSILCFDPYFTMETLGTFSDNPIPASGSAATELSVLGTEEVGVLLVIEKYSSGSDYVGTIDFWTNYSDNATKMAIGSITISDDHELHISTEPGNKYIKRKTKSTGAWTFYTYTLGSNIIWPLLKPDMFGSANWRIQCQTASKLKSTLTYKQRFGGI